MLVQQGQDTIESGRECNQSRDTKVYDTHTRDIIMLQAPEKKNWAIGLNVDKSRSCVKRRMGMERDEHEQQVNQLKSSLTIDR
jgi:hypothetical protein